ncbi:uro-adherence factor A [Nematostella vectensis]|nr:uro-adherence factor A [Nematostella vectensis]
MEGFEIQPSTSSRQRTGSNATVDDSLSEMSGTKVDLEALRRERSHRKEADQLYTRLQAEYDNLLTKYAQAENTIDQLRIGAKLNLYSDLPPPQRGQVISVSTGKQPRIFDFPRANQAVLSPSTNVEHDRSTSRDSIGTGGNSNLALTPDLRAEGIRTSLMFQVESLQENIDDLQEQVTHGEWSEPELKELHEICTHLIRQHKQMKRELKEAKNLENRSRGKSLSETESLNGEFLLEDSLEGQLYRLGLRLDEVNEQIESSLLPLVTPLAQESRVQDYSGNGLPHTGSDIQGLRQRLQRVKDLSKQDDNLSRSANSLADVEDIESNDEFSQRGENSRHFSLDALPHEDDDDEDAKNGERGIDLQESGYFASETMSVSQHSEPLSNTYLSNSAGAGQLDFPRDETSLFDQNSVTSSPEDHRRDSTAFVSPDPPLPRATSQRNRSSTNESYLRASRGTSQPYPSQSQNTAYPESPDTPQPQASSSFLPEQPRPRSHSQTSRRSRASTSESRKPRDPLGSRQAPGHVDILRTNHDDPYAKLNESRDSSQSSPRNNRNALQNSVKPSPRERSQAPSHRPVARSMSGDSRVSTPLFLPHPGARPKLSNRPSKHRPVQAETERGFDSGFFGSEGSRVSRSVYSPDVAPARPVDKSQRTLIRQPSVTESEEEPLHVSAAQTPLRSASRSRDQRRRRSRLQSLSETDEELEMETSTKTPMRDRRGHRHTPTFPGSRSDAERSRRIDNLRRPSSSPNLYDPASDRLTSSGLGRSTSSRHQASRRTKVDLDTTGPRSDHENRPMDKQSLRGYPMDRESVRSGRRSRRDGDSSSAYSDGARKYKRDPVEKLRAELQRLGAQLQEEASARTMQTHMYDDLRRKHDDLEREIARRNAEQQMSSMYNGLRSKYDELASRMGEPSRTPRQGTDDELKRCLEELAKEVRELKTNKGSENPGEVRFLCPFCGGCGGHHHGDYYYPGYAGPAAPAPDRPPSTHHETQAPYSGTAPLHARHATTPTATSTPFYQGVGVSPIHQHTSTYPGAVSGSHGFVAGPHGILTGSPIHHIHHLPRSRAGRLLDEEPGDYSSDEEERYQSKRRSGSTRPRRTPRRSFYEDEMLDSHRLHLSLDEANRAARHMQKVSKRMLSSIASDLIRSGQR